MLRQPITPQELETVLSHYNVGLLHGDPQPGSGTANTNLRLETSTGIYFLKRRNPKYAVESYVAFDHALMEYLAPFDLGTPLAIPTREGRRWLRLEGEVYELCPFRPGGPHDRHSLPQIAAAGRSLAAYHRAVRDFAPPPGKEWPRYDSPCLTREGVEAMCEELGQRLSAEECAYLMDQVALLESALPDERYRSLPRLVIHGDYHPGNLLFQENEVSGVFDLDWATVQPRLRDLADGLFLFCGERASDIDAGDIFSLTQTWQPSPERNRVFMDAYLSGNRLSSEEASALPLFVRARWLYCRVSGMAKVAPEHRLDYFTSGLLKPLKALDEMERLI
ncbi:MAG: phosphotransferase [Armatimonadetes bacterium]|nr:phosphotransferase [Armatimonadota bacterium]